MGYTHYFTQKLDISNLQWDSIISAVDKIYGYSRSELKIQLNSHPADWHSRGIITINGVEDDAHEDFTIRREKAKDGFSFCKTAKKLYDLPVCMILLVLNGLVAQAFDIGSDGRWGEEWERAREEYKKLFGDEPTCPWVE